MDALGCMKSLLLAATQYRAAKTPANAALLQRSLEVGAAPDGAGRPGAWGWPWPWCSFGLWGREWLFLGPGLGRLPSAASALGGRSAGSGAPGVSSGPFRPRRCPQALVRPDLRPAPRLSGRRQENPAGDRLLRELVAEGQKKLLSFLQHPQTITVSSIIMFYGVCVYFETFICT